MESYAQAPGFERTSAISPLCLAISETGSTQDDARAWWAENDIPSYSVLLTNHQSAGRGRLGRHWEEPAGSSLLASIIVSVEDTPANREDLGWLTLIAALAAREGSESLVRNPDATSAEVFPKIQLKWPNDVVVHNDACADQHRNLKVGGVLGELLGVRNGLITCSLGIGINLHQLPGEFPIETATSLRISYPLAGIDTGSEDTKDRLLASILAGLKTRVEAWQGADGATRNQPLLADLSANSADLNNSITLTLADGTQVSGHVRRFTENAGIELDTFDGPVTISTDDVAMLAAEGL